MALHQKSHPRQRLLPGGTPRNDTRYYVRNVIESSNGDITTGTQDDGTRMLLSKAGQVMGRGATSTDCRFVNCRTLTPFSPNPIFPTSPRYCSPNALQKRVYDILYENQFSFEITLTIVSGTSSGTVVVSGNPNSRKYGDVSLANFSFSFSPGLNARCIRRAFFGTGT